MIESMTPNHSLQRTRRKRRAAERGRWASTQRDQHYRPLVACLDLAIRQGDRYSNMSRPCTISARAATCLLLLSCLVVSVRATRADEALCPGTSVSVQSLDKEDAETGCKGAADAVAFLSALALDTTAPVEVRFVERIPDVVGGATALGCNVNAERRIYMLTFSECQKLGLAPGLPIDRALHRSLVAHEVAHHIAAANFKVEKPAVAAHEYIAYVTMLATMEPYQRDRILERFPGDGFDTERQFNLTLYMVAPHFFGAQAYRHFMRLEDRQAFLQRVLSGTTLLDEEKP